MNTRAINAGLALLALMVVPAVRAERIKFDVPACISEADWDALGDAAAQNDLDGLQQLHRDRQCTWLRSGDQVTIVDLGFETWFASRVFSCGRRLTPLTSIEVWGPLEAPLCAGPGPVMWSPP